MKVSATQNTPPPSTLLNNLPVPPPSTWIRNNSHSYFLLFNEHIDAAAFVLHCRTIFPDGVASLASTAPTFFQSPLISFPSDTQSADTISRQAHTFLGLDPNSATTSDGRCWITTLNHDAATDALASLLRCIPGVAFSRSRRKKTAPPPITVAPSPRLFVPHRRHTDVKDLLNIGVQYIDLTTNPKGTFSHVTYADVDNATAALHILANTTTGAAYALPLSSSRMAALTGVLALPPLAPPPPQPAWVHTAPAAAAISPGLAFPPLTSTSLSSTSLIPSTLIGNRKPGWSSFPSATITAIPPSVFSSSVATSAPPPSGCDGEDTDLCTYTDAEPTPATQPLPLPSAATSLLRLLRLAPTCESIAGSDEEKLQYLITSSQIASAASDTSDAASAASGADISDDELSTPLLVVVTDVIFLLPTSASSLVSKHLISAFYLPPDDLPQVLKDANLPADALFFTIPSSTTRNAHSKLASSYFEGLPMLPPDQVVNLLHKFQCLRSQLPPPLSPLRTAHSTRPFSTAHDLPNSVTVHTGDGFGSCRAILLGLLDVYSHSPDALRASLCSLSFLSGIEHPLLPLNLQTPSAELIDHALSSPSTSPLAALRTAAAQYVGLNAYLPYFSSHQTWEDVTIREDWPVLIAVPDENDELAHLEHTSLEHFLQDLLDPSSLPTTLSLSAMAQAARVNLDVKFPSPEQALMYKGESGGHTTTDNVLHILVYPSAPTLLIHVVEGQFCIMLTPKQNSTTV